MIKRLTGPSHSADLPLQTKIYYRFLSSDRLILRSIRALDQFPHSTCLIRPGRPIYEIYVECESATQSQPGPKASSTKPTWSEILSSVARLAIITKK